MRTNSHPKSRPLWTCLVLLCLSATPLSAEQFGLFTYSVDGDEVIITNYPEDARGDVEIPAEINGKPVTKIGGYAFTGCTSLTFAVFLGDAPSTFSVEVFDDTAPEFTVCYLSGSADFTKPTWNGYPTIWVDPALDRSPISSVALIPAGTRLTIRVTLGLLVQIIGVEYSPDLSPGSWIELGNFFFSADAVMEFTDPDAVRRARTSGYYRAFLRPELP